RERARLVLLQPRVVEQHPRDDERPRERASPGLVRACDETCSEPPVELQELRAGPLHQRPRIARGSVGDYSPARTASGSASAAVGSSAGSSSSAAAPTSSSAAAPSSRSAAAGSAAGGASAAASAAAAAACCRVPPAP